MNTIVTIGVLDASWGVNEAPFVVNRDVSSVGRMSFGISQYIA